ncbi:hypothetical protein J3458_019647 [Metarhizium acridum]|uniref:BHLH domain-containing protein n=1 Tax=Metarhizium acridum (strain CQMa 102) TaxID=655827 RepID=E9DV15_METAQ|nr:uncharacterized protein MAC_01405 [Metarhizium acridum CQMa 102]EFY92439.1 hypothetical protein MAC_01405 [Metarhizium acridum CQMa 102]KAG8408622.1 hypothetical protein J3458_019647 [Metarhizium acridum]
MAPSHSENKEKQKKRVRNWTADDRAVHRVFERSRREAFKESLQNLAALIPSLNSVDPGKLSKHVVVDEAIAHLQEMNQKASESQMVIDSLLAERQQLLAEMSLWRASAGMESCALPASTPEIAYSVETGAEVPVPTANLTDASGQLENLSQLGSEIDVMAMEPLAVPGAGGTLEGLPQVAELLASKNATCGVASWQTMDYGIGSLS